PLLRRLQLDVPEQRGPRRQPDRHAREPELPAGRIGNGTAIPRLRAVDEDRFLDAGCELRDGNAVLIGTGGPHVPPPLPDRSLAEPDPGELRGSARPAPSTPTTGVRARPSRRTLLGEPSRFPVPGHPSSRHRLAGLSSLPRMEPALLRHASGPAR